MIKERFKIHRKSIITIIACVVSIVICISVAFPISKHLLNNHETAGNSSVESFVSQASSSSRTSGPNWSTASSDLNTSNKQNSFGNQHGNTSQLPILETVVRDVVYPEIKSKTMQFTLSQKDFNDFEETLSLCKKYYYATQPGTEETFLTYLYKVRNFEVLFETQMGVAKILLDCDLSNNKAKSDYQYATSVESQVSDSIWDFYNDAEEEKNNFYPILKDFKEKQYPNIIYKMPSADTYYAKMDNIAVNFKSLGENADESVVRDLYLQYIEAATNYAKDCGYDNYYEYASNRVYYRDYGKSERQKIRQYVKEYLIPLYRDVTLVSKLYDTTLSSSQFNLSVSYLEDSYKSFAVNYVDGYIKTLPKVARDKMNSAFTLDRVLISSKPNAYNNAYVQEIGNTPICYFSQEKSNMVAMTHELGHYLADVSDRPDKTSYDIREVHSFSNSLLFLQYLDNTINTKASESAKLYEISNLLYLAISYVVRDEFDEIILTNPKKYTISELEQIMQGLIDKYDVADLTSKSSYQLLTYWKRLAIDGYMVYNISYTVSIITSLQIFTESLTDYSAATQSYLKTINIDSNSSFLGTLKNAGLKSPTTEQAYISLSNSLYDWLDEVRSDMFG